MNPEFIAANYVHTIPEKLTEYFIEPFTDFRIVLALIIMFANVYMSRKLRRIKRRDYLEIINLFTVGIYCVCSIISAVLVSRLGPHGKVAVDLCDAKYMTIPIILFIIVSIINVVCFIINIITKLKKDKECAETIERGYFAEEKTYEEKNHHVNASFLGNIKDKIDIDGVKDKVTSITEDIKEMVNSKIKKDE